MNWFEPLRHQILQHLDLLRWLGPGGAGLLALALVLWRGRNGVKPALLLLIFGLAGLGQAYIGQQAWLAGGLLYAGAAVLLAAWLLILRGDRELDMPAPGRLSRETEVLLVLVVLLVAAYGRFSRLDQIPYGIEGDEAKWSVQVAAEMFADQGRWDSDFRREHVPYTYWVEAFFYRLMGISIQTARWQVAFLSLIATGLFYLLARQMLGPPGALIAAWLLAVSTVDISASRLSHVESQIKLPLIAAFTCLVYAVSTRRWYWYLLAGLATAAGLLVFDTFFLAPAVIGLWMGWRLLLDRRVTWWGKLGRLLLYLAPILPVAQKSWFYIMVRRGDHNKSVMSLTREGLAGSGALLAGLRASLAETLMNFSHQRWGDFLHNRDGPIFNALLIPLAAIGLVYLLARWRNVQNGLAPLWFLLLFFPAAVVFGSPWVRVFYPAYPAFYLLVAAAIMLLARSGARLIETLPAHDAGGREWYRRAGWTLLAAFLVLVGANNLYVYFHETKDFPDRITRREMADMTAANLAEGQRLYAPYMPFYDDFLEWDREFLQFVVWGKAPVDRDADYYRLLPYGELLPALAADAPFLQGAAILFDHAAEMLAGQRRAVLDAVARCYPGVTVQSGARFDVLAIPEAGLREPNCSAGVDVVAAPSPGAVLAGHPVTLAWATSPPGAGRSAQVEVARRPPGLAWLEAEDYFERPGWYVEGRFAPDFGGRGYLADWYNAADTTAQVVLPASGRYTVWARTHRRETADMPLNIAVGETVFPAAQHSPAEYNTWRWERLGEVDLAGESVQITIHREFGAGRHMSIFIDALVLSPAPAYDPEAGPWPVYFRSEIVPAREGRFELAPVGAVPPLAGQPGAGISDKGVRWPVRVIDGDRLVDAVLVVDDPAFDIAAQQIWQLLGAAPLPAAAQVNLPAGQYRWRVRILDGDRIIGPWGETGRWSSWTEFRVD